MSVGKPFPKDIKEMNVDVFREIWRRIYHEDDAVNIIFIGGTGTGKSTSALYFGWCLDRGVNYEHTFSIENNVYHKFTDFIKAVKTARKGKVLILEEAGTREGLYKRDWFTVGNKAGAELMQIARRLNLILIFVLPARKYLDSDVRDFFQIQVWSKRKDLRKRRGYCSVKYINRDMERGKEYPAYPVAKTESGILVSLTEFEVPPPPRYLLDAWKGYEAEFKSDIIDKSVALIEAENSKDQEKEDKRGGAKVDLDKYFSEIMENRAEYTKTIGAHKSLKFNKELIYGKLRLDGRGPGMQTAKILMEMANKELEKGEKSEVKG